MDLEAFKIMARNKFDTNPANAEHAIHTYFVSQDHLEILNGNLRKGGGCNRNPTCLQFISRMRSIFNTSQIKLRHGNAQVFGHVPVLKAIHQVKISETALNIASNLSSDIDSDENELDNEIEMINEAPSNIQEPQEPTVSEFNIIEKYGLESFNFFKLNAIGIRASKVLENLRKNYKCLVCVLSCLEEKDESSELSVKLYRAQCKIDVVPSKSLINFCKVNNDVFDQLVREKGNSFMSNAKFEEIVYAKIFYNADFMTIFPQIRSHLMVSEKFNDHLILLTKSIVAIYSDIKKKELMKMINVGKNDLTRPKLIQLLNNTNQ